MVANRNKDKLLFGTAGVPRSAKDASTIAGLEELKRLGLDCLEIEFVQRVAMGEKTAGLVKEVAGKMNIALSIHAPYYINLNSHDPDKKKSSRQRLLEASRIGYLCGATDIIFHAGFYTGDSPKETYSVIRDELALILEELSQQGVKVTLRVETMGKHSQFGSLEETLSLAEELRGLLPCIDFSHLHARKRYKNKEDFLNDLYKIKDALGEEALRSLHIHLSGMQYTEKGEKNHLNLKESDFPLEDLLLALKEVHAAGRIISESPNLEEDALYIKGCWRPISQS